MKWPLFGTLGFDFICIDPCVPSISRRNLSFACRQVQHAHQISIRRRPALRETRNHRGGRAFCNPAPFGDVSSFWPHFRQISTKRMSEDIIGLRAGLSADLLASAVISSGASCAQPVQPTGRSQTFSCDKNQARRASQRKHCSCRSSQDQLRMFRSPRTHSLWRSMKKRQ
jgi:hypothetical protein